MANMNLKSRILNDKDFFKKIFTKVPASKALAKVQERYPEAIEYIKPAGRITFRARIDPSIYVWLDYANGDLECTVISIPPREEDYTEE